MGGNSTQQHISFNAPADCSIYLTASNDLFPSCSFHFKSFQGPTVEMQHRAGYDPTDFISQHWFQYGWFHVYTLGKLETRHLSESGVEQK